MLIVIPDFVIIGLVFMNGSFLLLPGLLLLLGLQASSGRTYIITDLHDTIKVTSLRGAIIDANQRSEESVIMLGRAIPHQKNQQWIFHLTISGADEENGRTGDLNITPDSPHGGTSRTAVRGVCLAPCLSPPSPAD